jgi:hypothetical protein
MESLAGSEMQFHLPGGVLSDSQFAFESAKAYMGRPCTSFSIGRDTSTAGLFYLCHEMLPRLWTPAAAGIVGTKRDKLLFDINLRRLFYQSNAIIRET